MTAALLTSCSQTLTGWAAPDQAQETLRRDYLEHLDQHADGWARSCAGAHLTASSLICSADGGHVLLTLHARIGRWLQTGGHIESTDSSLEAAALREATEESGLADLRLDPVPVLLSRHQVPCGVVRPTYHLDVQYLVVADPAESPVISSESEDVRWFPAGVLLERDGGLNRDGGLDRDGRPDAEHVPEVDQTVRDLIVAARGRLQARTALSR